MAFTTSCCTNLSNASPPSLPSKPTQLPRHGMARSEKWRKECVVGMACCSVIIGMEMGSFGDGSSAVGLDMGRLQLVIEVADSKQQNDNNDKVPRWSDKRMCAPWHYNSLETIVPENLPRPAARRRWESVGYSKNAPVVRGGSSSNSCFSM